MVDMMVEMLVLKMVLVMVEKLVVLMVVKLVLMLVQTTEYLWDEMTVVTLVLMLV